MTPKPRAEPCGRRSPDATRDRIHKLLAGRGVGSTRQIEAWVAAGRITVNGRPAQPGQPVSARDDIRLDGRRLRLRAADADRPAGLVYHRPPREEVRGTEQASGRGSLERLPRATGRRWIPVSPLAAGDGGLELFVTDGRLAAALMRRSHRIASEFSVRVGGGIEDARIAAVMNAATVGTDARGRLTAVEPAGGEGANRWVRVACIGLRPRDLKSVFAREGFEVNRVIRTSLGPVAMDRALARGRSRRMTVSELDGLRDLAESEVDRDSGSPPRARD